MTRRSLFVVLPALGMLVAWGSGCGRETSEVPGKGAAGAADGGGPDAGEDAGLHEVMDAMVVGAADGAAVDAPAEPDAITPADTGSPRRVFFVGNSYTEANDLPGVVRALGAANGVPIEVESLTPGGARLEHHWFSSGTRARIAMGRFDVVVLQGQSVEPIEDPESFLGYALQLSMAVRDAGAARVWFATWARREGDPIYANPGMSSPADMTSRLDQRYQWVAEQDKGVAARVGVAWQIALAELPAVALHADDGSHPAPAGTLLAACVILQAITGQAPRVPDPPPLGLARDTAAALCAIVPRVRCAEGQVFCEGECVYTGYDVRHCGACGVRCAEGDPCREGVCGCPGGQTGCSRICVDLQTDAKNCGACAATCSPGGICSAGVCACPRAAALKITLPQLSALRPACDSLEKAASLDCRTAAHRYCEALECFDSGFGPPLGHSPRVDAVMCLSGKVRTTTRATLQSFVPTCDPSQGIDQSCVTAISRYCASTGDVTGFGPIETAGDSVTVTCLPGAKVVRTTREEVGRFASRCFADPVMCGSASWGYCQSLGHAGGFGPVEVVGTDVDVVCLDR